MSKARHPQHTSKKIKQTQFSSRISTQQQKKIQPASNTKSPINYSQYDILVLISLVKMKIDN